MTHEEIITSIDNLTDNTFNIKKIESQLLSLVIQQIGANVKTDAGRITALNSSAGKIVKKSLKSFVETKQYQESLANLLVQINGLGTNKVNIYKKVGLNIVESEIKPIQEVSINFILDSLNEDGLNQKFNQPLRNLIYENVTKGASQTDLAKSLEKYLISTNETDSSFNKYFNQTVQQGADSYNAVVDQNITDRYWDRITHMKIIGSLIKTSSPQCKKAVVQYNRDIPKDELQSIVDYAKEHGGSTELTPKNLPIKKFHFGCRHSFTPIIKKK